MIITHNTTNNLNMTIFQRNYGITNIYNNVSLRNITFCNFRELYIMTVYFLTSSLRTPKIFVKEFSYFLMSCHQHCLGVNLLVQR